MSDDDEYEVIDIKPIVDEGEVDKYVLVVEWDGNKPPTTWYNRLRKMGVHVQGNKKEADIFVRRTHHTFETAKMSIPQEAVYFSTSPSQIQALAALASQMNPKPALIMTGVVSLKEKSMLTVDDTRLIDKLQGDFGKVGRPRKEEVIEEEILRELTITCLEEGATYFAPQTMTKSLHVCPQCGGLKIRVREGKPRTFSNIVPNGESLFSWWVRTRFVSGQFEVPELGMDVPPELSSTNINDKEDQLTINAISGSTKIYKSMRRLSDAEKLEILDGIYASRTHHTQDNRNRKRLDVFRRAQRASITTEMFEMPTEIQIEDASCALGVDRIVNLIIMSKKKKGEQND